MSGYLNILMNVLWKKKWVQRWDYFCQVPIQHCLVVFLNIRIGIKQCFLLNFFGNKCMITLYAFHLKMSIAMLT